MRREIKAYIKKQHGIYVNNLVGDVKANPGDFYRYINSQKRNRKCIPPLKKWRGNGVAELDSDKAEELISQFSDMFDKTEYNEVSLSRRSAPFMDSIVVE